MLSLEDESGSRCQIAKRLKPGDVNLDRLSLLDELGDKLIAQEIDLESAHRRLNAINRKKSNYPLYLKTLSYGIVSLAVSIIFSANYLEIIAFFIGGLIVGSISNYLVKIFKTERFLEFLLAFCIAFLSHIVFSLISKLNLGLSFSSNLVNISALIYLGSSPI